VQEAIATPHKGGVSMKDRVQKEQKVVNISEDKESTALVHVPTGGVFGNLDQQMTSVFGELALERMNAVNELAEVEAETNRVIQQEWIPIARQRQANARKLARQQGFSPQPFKAEGDTEPDAEE